MASEPTEEGAVNVDLSPELDEWLRGRAATLGVDPEAVLVQLVASYRAAAEFGGGDAGDGLAIELQGSDALGEVIEPAVEAVVEDDLSRLVAEEVEAALADRESVDAAAIDGQVEAALEERLDATIDARVDDRLGSVRSDFREKLEDVRSRVVQVKQETDAKAPADHDHEAFARLDAIGGRLADLEEDVEALETTLESVEEELTTLADDDGRFEDVEAEMADLEERLTTVAWVVSDLRDAYESKTGTAALEELKRAAAAEDVSRANCENCGKGVEIGLLTEPACPHCEATVTRVEPASGFFGKPQLLVASQLESGEE